MKLALVAALTLATAMPVISIPTASDAQVLTGRGGGRRAPAPRRAQPPRLTAEEQQAMWDAQDLVADLEAQIEDIRLAGEAAGGLSAEQRALMASHQARLDEAQATVDRLKAKRGV